MIGAYETRCEQSIGASQRPRFIGGTKGWIRGSTVNRGPRGPLRQSCIEALALFQMAAVGSSQLFVTAWGVTTTKTTSCSMELAPYLQLVSHLRKE